MIRVLRHFCALPTMAVSIKRPKFYTFLRLLSSNRSMALKKAWAFRFFYGLTAVFSHRIRGLPCRRCPLRHSVQQGFHRPGPEGHGAGAETIRIGSSPMTPAQVLVDLMPQLQDFDQRIKFQVIPFENTPENAREILSHLGRNIDVVAGIFDETMLRLRRCQGFELKRTPLCCALSLHHPLARKDFLTVEDLHGEALMLIREGWNHYVDELRHNLMDGHPEIKLIDLYFIDTEAFNECDRKNALLMAVPQWKLFILFLRSFL